MARPIPPSSARRVNDGSNDITRYEGSNGANNRSNRWPTLSQTQISNGRVTTADEKVRRSQVYRKEKKVSLTILFNITYSFYSKIFIIEVGYFED